MTPSATVLIPTFNEAHNVPLTRTLTVQLLSKLRADGYDYFAAVVTVVSMASRQPRVVSCRPVPNAMPASMISGSVPRGRRPSTWPPRT